MKKTEERVEKYDVPHVFAKINFQYSHKHTKHVYNRTGANVVKKMKACHKLHLFLNLRYPSLLKISCAMFVMQL